MNIPSYPKVYNLGHAAIQELFLDPVIIQEKVDGSQMSFGCLDGQLACRSKGREIHPGSEDKTFLSAMATVERLHAEGRLTPELVYRGEVLASPRHNVLKYDRVPTGNIVLFDASMAEENYVPYEELSARALYLGLEVVPRLHPGNVLIHSVEDLEGLLETESFLGGTKIEGVVCKNYLRFGLDKKVLMGKYVRPEYRELAHQKGPHTTVDFVSDLAASYTTEARWEKAVEHLRDQGELKGDPRDIGPLIKEVSRDIQEEEGEAIAEKLFHYYWHRVIGRHVTRGLPEWYKARCAARQFTSLEIEVSDLGPDS